MNKFSKFKVLIPALAALLLLPLSPAISADPIVWNAINVKDPHEGVKKLFKILCNLFFNKRGS
jgi:hypothetical protein